jgi:hypothetical protein
VADGVGDRSLEHYSLGPGGQPGSHARLGPVGTSSKSSYAAGGQTQAQGADLPRWALICVRCNRPSGEGYGLTVESWDTPRSLPAHCTHYIRSGRLSVLKEAVLDFTCPACSGDLLKPTSELGGGVILQCMACGDVLHQSDYAAKALAFALRTEAYIAMKDGGDSPLVHCPECGEKTFLTKEWECAACGAEPEHECARCGTGIPPEELDSAPFCGYCDYMMNKDD